MQAPVTDYFKTKKRTIEDASVSKAKLAAMAMTDAGGKSSPNPVKPKSHFSPESESNIKQESSDSDDESFVVIKSSRKVAKVRRQLTSASSEAKSKSKLKSDSSRSSIPVSTRSKGKNDTSILDHFQSNTPKASSATTSKERKIVKSEQPTNHLDVLKKKIEVLTQSREVKNEDILEDELNPSVKTERSKYSASENSSAVVKSLEKVSQKKSTTKVTIPEKHLDNNSTNLEKVINISTVPVKIQNISTTLEEIQKIPEKSPTKFIGRSNLCPESGSPVVKKLNAEEVKKLLKNKGNLTDLKAALVGINGCAQKLADFRKVAELEFRKSAKLPASSIAVVPPAVPSPSAAAVLSVSPSKFYSPSSSRDIFNSPAKLQDIQSSFKSPGRSVKRLFQSEPENSITSATASAEGNVNSPKKRHAFERFNHLTQRTSTTTTPPASPSKSQQDGSSEAVSSEASSLALPYKFRVLADIFNGVETVAAILHNRKEIITFAKLKAAVHELVRRTPLKQKHISQILAVYPGCYSMSQEKFKANSALTYQLVMTLNVDKNALMTATTVTQRRRIFHQNLISICRDCHKAFLESLEIIVPEGTVVTRWHPKFRLDEIPDIQGVNLPQAPEESKVSTAQDVMTKAKHIFDNGNPRMKKALEDLMEKTAKIEDAKKSSNNEPQTLNQINSKKTTVALKGISQSLIEKVRARQQQKSINALTITPEESKRKVMLSRLPEFVKILRNVMVAEKKSALPISIAVERLSHSNHGAISYGEVEEHIHLMTSVLPDWLGVHSLSTGEYVKMDKQIDINDLLEKLKHLIQKA